MTLEVMLQTVGEYLDYVSQTPADKVSLASDEGRAMQALIEELRDGAEFPAYPVETEGAMCDGAEMVGDAFSHAMSLIARSESVSPEDLADFLASHFMAAVVFGMTLGYDLGANEMWNGFDEDSKQHADLELID